MHTIRIVAWSVGLMLSATAAWAQSSRPCAGGGDVRPGQLVGIALAAASDGSLYHAERTSARVRRTTPTGVTTDVAGTGVRGFSGDGGPATSAQLGLVTHLAVDRAGNLFVAETEPVRIRKVAPSGTITTFAGNGTTLFSGDGGAATSASLCQVTGMAIDGQGNLYVGSGIPGFDSDGGSDYRIRRVTPAGVITTHAGTGAAPRETDGDGGPALAAHVHVRSLAADSAGNLFLTDGSRIRKITAAGIITTIAGVTNRRGFTEDGKPALAATLGIINAIAVDGNGNPVFSEGSNNRIRKVAGDGSLSTVLVNPDSEPLRPSDLTVDAAGNVFVVGTVFGATPADATLQVFRVSPDGKASVFLRIP